MENLRIRILLDDSAPLYPDDVAGCLLFEGDGSEARTDYGQVDLFLLELTSGVERLLRQPESWVDLPGERTSLRFSRNEQGERLDYREAEWRLPSGEIRRALIGAVAELLGSFREFRPFVEEGNLAQLEVWLSNQPDQ